MEDKPTLDKVKGTVEKIEAFLAYLVKLWKTKSWSTILVLLNTILLLCFNPASAGVLLSLLPLEEGSLPSFYQPVYWLVISLIFVAAFILALVKGADKTVKKVETSPVKGLLAFESYERDIFSHLQRSNQVTECVTSIINSNYEFGLMIGPAGAGKTSLLKAGLSGALADRNIDSVYVKFDENNLEESLVYALNDQLSDQVRNSKKITKESLKKLSEKLQYTDDNPLVLILDQFEQAFLHDGYQKLETLFFKSFFTGLAENIKKNIKVLIVLQREFAHLFSRFYSVLDQKKMVYFQVKNFTPRDAAAIFKVIADQEEIKYDSRFLELLCRRFLADKNEGLVCPVDIQITARVFLDSYAQEQQDLSARWFNSIGKFEGLYEIFITKVLTERLEGKDNKKNAVKVLRALAQVQQKHAGHHVSFGDISYNLPRIGKSKLRTILNALTCNYIRLAGHTRHNNKLYYFLFNPRIAPVIENIYFKESHIQRSSILLDRRVTEWIGSDYKGKYLLKLLELFKITREKPDLDYGGMKEEKKRFIRNSWIKKAVQTGIILLVLAACLTGYSFWSSKTGISWRMKMRLTSLSMKLEDPQLNSYLEKLKNNNDKNPPYSSDLSHPLQDKKTAPVPNKLSNTVIVDEAIIEAYRKIIDSCLGIIKESGDSAELNEVTRIIRAVTHGIESEGLQARYLLETADLLVYKQPALSRQLVLEAEELVKLVRSDYERYSLQIKVIKLDTSQNKELTYSSIKKLEKEVLNKVEAPLTKLYLLSDMLLVHAVLVSDDLEEMTSELAELTNSIGKNPHYRKLEQHYYHCTAIVKTLVHIDSQLVKHYIRTLDDSWVKSRLYLEAAKNVPYEKGLTFLPELSSPLDKALIYGLHRNTIKLLPAEKKEAIVTETLSLVKKADKKGPIAPYQANCLAGLYALIQELTQGETSDPGYLNNIRQLTESIENKTEAARIIIDMARITREPSVSLSQLDEAWNLLIPPPLDRASLAGIIRLIDYSAKLNKARGRDYFIQAEKAFQGIQTAELKASAYLELTELAEKLVPHRTTVFTELTAESIRDVPLLLTRASLYCKLLELLIDNGESKKKAANAIVAELLDISQKLHQAPDTTADTEYEAVIVNLKKISGQLKSINMTRDFSDFITQKKIIDGEKQIEIVTGAIGETLGKIKNSDEKNKLLLNFVSILCRFDCEKAADLAAAIPEPAYHLQGITQIARYMARTQGMEAFSMIRYLRDKEYDFYLKSELLLEIMKKDANQAAELTEEIVNPSYRDFCFLRLLSKLDGKRFKNIIISLKGVPPVSMDSILIEIARSFAGNNQIDRVQQYIHLIGDANKKDNFALETISMLTGMYPEKSEQIARTISNNQKKDRAYALVALSYGRNKRYDRAFYMTKKCTTRIGEAYALAGVLELLKNNGFSQEDMGK